MEILLNLINSLQDALGLVEEIIEKLSESGQITQLKMAFLNLFQAFGHLFDSIF